MTKQQETILENYLKTIGYKKVSTKYNYFDELETTTNEISKFKKNIEIFRKFKKVDKEKLIISQSNISKLKQNPNYPEGLYMEYVEIAKKRQDEYNESTTFLKKEISVLSSLERKLARLYREQDEIANVAFSFGPDIRDEHGNTCGRCGCNDAYLQINPYASEIRRTQEMIMVCDSCADLLAEEI